MKRKQEAHTHEDEAATPDCCKKKPVGNKIIIASCGCPCGNEKNFAMPGGSTDEILPYYFSEKLDLSYTEPQYPDLSHLLISRYGEPPDPPPIEA
jgi:hypothetical protein